MSNQSSLAHLTYGRAKRKAVAAGKTCRETTWSGTPFTDIDTALERAGLKKS